MSMKYEICIAFRSVALIHYVKAARRATTGSSRYDQQSTFMPDVTHQGQQELSYNRGDYLYVSSDDIRPQGPVSVATVQESL
jgi:hypothetical protein